jgi:hypothetical protein
VVWLITALQLRYLRSEIEATADPANYATQVSYSAEALDDTALDHWIARARGFNRAERTWFHSPQNGPDSPTPKTDE